MIRLGVIGCGTWGKNYVRAAAEAGNCAVTHVAGSGAVDGPIERIPSRDWRRLLDAQLDAFVVAAPPSVHPAICTELLDRGRAVLVEKPMATDERALGIADAALASGAPLLVAHQHLFAIAYEELRELARDWKNVTVVTEGGGLGPRREYSALWDYGPHDVAMFLGLTQSHRASGVGAARRGDSFRIGLQSGDRVGLVRVWNDALPKTRLLTALSGAESIAYDDLDPTGARLRLNGQVLPLPHERPLTRMVRVFAEMCAGKSQDWRFDPFLGVEVTRLLAEAEATITTANDAVRPSCS